MFRNFEHKLQVYPFKSSVLYRNIVYKKDIERNSMTIYVCEIFTAFAS